MRTKCGPSNRAANFREQREPVEASIPFPCLKERKEKEKARGRRAEDPTTKLLLRLHRRLPAQSHCLQLKVWTGALLQVAPAVSSVENMDMDSEIVQDVDNIQLVVAKDRRRARFGWRL